MQASTCGFSEDPLEVAAFAGSPYSWPLAEIVALEASRPSSQLRAVGATTDLPKPFTISPALSKAYGSTTANYREASCRKLRIVKKGMIVTLQYNTYLRSVEGGRGDAGCVSRSGACGACSGILHL